RIQGRTLRPEDTDACMIEQGLADELHVKLGDTIYLVEKTPDLENPERRHWMGLKVVGLVEHRRVAKQQLPIVIAPMHRIQHLAGYDQAPQKVSKIDIILKDGSIH